MEDYTYTTPQGYGDTFYVYAYDTDTSGFTPGTDALNQRIIISDGEFVVRWWRGVDQLGNAARSVQIRDRLQNRYFSDTLNLEPATGSLMNAYMNTGWPVCPEKWYPDSGYIGFDLFTIQPN
jgi:hypothetical protein